MDKVSSLTFAIQKIRDIKKKKWPGLLRDLRSEAQDIINLKIPQIPKKGFEQWKHQRQAWSKQIEDKRGLNPHRNLRALVKVSLSGGRL